ncbi:MAG: class I SAM-dependent methyltransferase [Methylophilus sp.]|jgi:2-polyprenyl-3-methyl-5-hydroxy-6-metoxy-1,4-benzoquinol methylase
MTKADTHLIDQIWPKHELEHTETCPYCGSSERSLAFQDVQDWSFYCAPGKWSYWDCTQCSALYQNPRPTESSIGRAYTAYYTHTYNNASFKSILKTRFKNECLSQWLHANFAPRLNIPKAFRFLFTPLRKLIGIPFELPFLASSSKGTLLDVGCGSGAKLQLAKNLGFEVTGLELDTNAVAVARSEGLNVILGDYKSLEQFNTTFNYIICSHVLEHVHEPIELLKLLIGTLSENGTLLLSLPNAQSHLRQHFSENWRGIEAPRHIAIPTARQINNIINKFGVFQVQQVACHYNTLAESRRLQRRELKSNFIDFMLLKLLANNKKNMTIENSDYIQLIITKVKS